MRKYIDLVEQVLDEINIIPDFDDELNASRKYNTWDEEIARAEKVGQIKDAEILRLGHSSIILYFLTVDGKPICRARMMETDDPTVVRASHVWLDPAFRNKGYALGLYAFILDSGLTIRSDTDQTRSAHRLWVSLAKRYAVRPLFQDGTIGPPTKDIRQFYNSYWPVLLASKD